MNAPQVSITAIPGLLVVDLPVHGDNRGWFKENWQQEKLAAAGLPDFGPVQNNISFNAARGTTRGIHAEPWDKYVSVATGRIFGAWVDLRGGETFGAVVTVELGPEKAVFVPRGVGNAFQTLEDDTAYTYLVNDHWSAENQDAYSFLNLADETVAIEWPILLEHAQLSEKDRHHPRMAEVEPLDPAPVLVVGKNGQLGRALVHLLEERSLPYLALGRDELDLAAPGEWPAIRWRDYRAVINAAACTAVDTAETPEGRLDAWAVNATGVTTLARACGEAGVPLLHVSTDYVFDGTLPAGQQYEVDDAVCPVSVYGQSKAAGEAAVAALPAHHVVRTSWVIGEGKNFVSTMAALAEKGIDPDVVDDQTGRLTFAADLAEGLLALLDQQVPWGTHHFTNAGEPITWYGVAREVYAAVGADPERVSPITTAEFTADKDGIAPRPENSVLCRTVPPGTALDVDHLARLHEFLTG
ncbi:sugar nucleotide-binding protein [Kocuria sp. M1R5S2]